MHSVDLDNIATWPANVTSFLTVHSDELRAERGADIKYILSPTTYRMMNGAPLMPRWDDTKALIEIAMADRELLAFHATRLIDFADIREQGLHMLVLEQHVIRVKRNIQDVGDVDAIAEIDAAVAKMLKADWT